MAGLLDFDWRIQPLGVGRSYPRPWLCSSVLAEECDLVSSSWICNDSLKHKIGAKMLLELVVSFLCHAREFLCPRCRRWCTSRGFLGWLPRGVESLRVFHVLHFVWCSFAVLQPKSESWEVTAKGVLSTPHWQGAGTGPWSVVGGDVEKVKDPARVS